MVKRKRKAPKRRRRNRFGNPMVNELKKELMAPVGEALEAATDTESFTDKLKQATSKLGDKKEAVTTAANSIKDKLIADLKASDDQLKTTKEAIKNAGIEGAKAFYAMIDASGINTKIGKIFEDTKAKVLKKLGPAGAAMGKLFTLEKLGMALETLYSKVSLDKKIFFHILSKILKGEGFVNKEEALLEEAGGAAKAAATAALDAGKKAVTEAKKPETKPETTTTTETKEDKTTPATKFGKRKRGPSASLKRMCKKHGVRLTVKRGKKRVYKSSKVLKGECQRKLKNKLKKNFGRKKIKRSGIMAPRKSRGKKRSRLSSATRGAKRRVSSAARYARRNPGRIAGGALGLGALGLGGYEAYLAAKRHGLKKGRSFTGNQGLKEAIEFEKFKRSNPYESPTAAAFRRAKGGAMEMHTSLKEFSGLTREQQKAYLSTLSKNQLNKIIESAQAAKRSVGNRAASIRDSITGFFSRKQPQQPQETDVESLYGKRRRRRRRKSKYDFGKKAKKPSAATRRMCKRLKVKMTLKRGGKRVYKSEAMLKKQCKKAMKRKSKK